MTEIPTRIVCAAMCIRVGDKRIVIPSLRHYDCFVHQHPLIESLPPTERKEIQGFLDNRSVFHDRQAAWKIAVEQKQILRRVGGDIADGGTLYSENLY